MPLLLVETRSSFQKIHRVSKRASLPDSTRMSANIVSMHRYVCYCRLTDNQTAPAFVRY